MMADPCKYCPIRSGCDILSELCRLRPEEIPQLRPDLVKTPKVLTPQQASSRKYLANNRPRRLETERQWRVRHKDAITARQQDWWAENRDEINTKRRARRKMKTAGPKMPRSGRANAKALFDGPIPDNPEYRELVNGILDAKRQREL